MDHKSLLSSLPTETRQNLLQKSDFKGLRHLAGFWGLMILCGLAVGFQIPFWPVFLLPLGILLIFNFTLLHETVHLPPFATPWLNRIVGRITAILVVQPYDWFRYFHLAHHKYTNDPENDPELASAKPETKWQYIRHVSGLPVWASQFQKLRINAVGPCQDSFVPKSALGKVKTEARWMLALYAAVLLLILSGQYWLFWCWVVPALLGQPFLRLYLLAEHGRCPPVANMFENTRTTFTTTLVRFLAWNMPYHCEHHAYPAVPFHRLPEFHALTKEHLISTSQGYSEFHGEFIAGFNSNSQA